MDKKLIITIITCSSVVFIIALYHIYYRYKSPKNKDKDKKLIPIVNAFNAYTITYPSSATKENIVNALTSTIQAYSLTDEAVTDNGPYELIIDSNSGEINALPAVPVGSIIMWSGLVDNVPDGWILCNGQIIPNSTTKTPDLTGKFILGGGNIPTVTADQYPFRIGTVGGEEFHKLTTAEMPTHNHGQDIIHRSNRNRSGKRSYVTGNPEVNMYVGGDPRNPKVTDGEVNGKGSDTFPHNNMPPFYALAYIMKYNLRVE